MCIVRRGTSSPTSQSGRGADDCSLQPLIVSHAALTRAASAQKRL